MNGLLGVGGELWLPVALAVLLLVDAVLLVLLVLLAELLASWMVVSEWSCNVPRGPKAFRVCRGWIRRDRGGRLEGVPWLVSLIAAELETAKALSWVCPPTRAMAATGLEALMKKDMMYVYVVLLIMVCSKV